MPYHRDHRQRVRYVSLTTLPPEMQGRDHRGLLNVYGASDGDATTTLYDELRAMGPVGEIALNMFRAQKNSARAKMYRPGRFGFRSDAYARKNDSIHRLTDALALHAASAGIVWGWLEDDTRDVHNWILYVDLPTGQVSFHTVARGQGPNYKGRWDGVRQAAPPRICHWIASLFDPAAASQWPAGGVSVGSGSGPEPMERTDDETQPPRGREPEQQSLNI